MATSAVTHATRSASRCTGVHSAGCRDRINLHSSDVLQHRSDVCLLHAAYPLRCVNSGLCARTGTHCVAPLAPQPNRGRLGGFYGRGARCCRARAVIRVLRLSRPAHAYSRSGYCAAAACGYTHRGADQVAAAIPVTRARWSDVVLRVSLALAIAGVLSLWPCRCIAHGRWLPVHLDAPSGMAEPPISGAAVAPCALESNTSVDAHAADSWRHDRLSCGRSRGGKRPAAARRKQ